MVTEVNDEKLKQVREIIEQIAGSRDEAEIKELEASLREITGRSDISASDCFEYWSHTGLTDLAMTFLLPEPAKQGLDDDRLAEIIENIWFARYSSPETDYQLKVLKIETGLSNISDYIYYPDTVGLDPDAGVWTIIEKIFEDRNQPPIALTGN